MANTWKVGSHWLAGHGVLMLCLGMTLSALGSIMANPMHAELGYTLSTALTALCLLVAGVYFGVQEAKAYLGRSGAKYVLLAASLIVCWLMFWLIQSASLDIRLLAFLAGLHGLLWGVWNLRLAKRFQAYPGKAAVLCVLAGTTSAVGIILATWSSLSEISAVTAVACYMTFIGIQILVTTALLHRRLEAEREFAGWQQRETEEDPAMLKSA